MTLRQATALASVALLSVALGCNAPSAEDRAREAAAEIEASIQDFDTPALKQEVDPEVVKEVQTQLTTLKQYMGEVNGEIDPVLVNAIQAFQREKNDAIPWYRFWQRKPNDGLLTEELRKEIATAANAVG